MSLSTSGFSSKIAMLFLIELISAELFGLPNKKLNNGCIIPLLALFGLVCSKVAKIGPVDLISLAWWEDALGYI